MDRKPLVSVIIPTYNRADLLPRAIRSALTQTFKDFELIIVDDGSTDNTEALVKGFIKEDDRIRYIYQKNQGESEARNTGLLNARGRYIAFLDSDDEWLPSKIEKQLNLFKKSIFGERLGFVGCNAYVIKAQKSRNYGTSLVRKMPNYRGDVLEEILKFCFVFCPSSVLLKREAIMGRKFDTKLRIGPDWDMWIRISQDYYFDFVDEPLFSYYLHGENIMSTTAASRLVGDHQYFLEKHRLLYKKYPKAHSIRLRNIGSMYLLNGDTRTARKYFVKAIKIAPWYPRSWVNLIVSLFGSKFYKKILYQKRKMAGDFFIK